MTDWDGRFLLLRSVMMQRNALMVADQAAEAINDFRVALSLLSERDPFAEWGGLFGVRANIETLIRGLR